MSINDIKRILEQILSEEKGKKLHIRMEMPYTWGVTLSGEVDNKDINVSHEFEFAKYATQYRKDNPEEKCNIIDFILEDNGNFQQIPRYDAEFQKQQDLL